MCGVTRMIRSVSFFWYWLERNRAPSTGASPTHGNWSCAVLLVFCNRPPSMKLWPSRSSTVVEALRTISAGTEVPAIVTVLLVSIVLTSGLITRLIRPSLSTVGVKDRPTP